MSPRELQDRIAQLKQQIQQRTAQLQQQDAMLTNLAGRIQVYEEWLRDTNGEPEKEEG